MTLATSCPSCGTVFKVVEDQLKISEGWVRCGHCHDVFNALEGLFDLDRRDSVMQGLRTLPAPLAQQPVDDPRIPRVPNVTSRAGAGSFRQEVAQAPAPGAAVAPAPSSVLEPPADTSALPTPPPLVPPPAAVVVEPAVVAAPPRPVPPATSPAPAATAGTAPAAAAVPAAASAVLPASHPAAARPDPAAAPTRGPMPGDSSDFVDAQDTVIVDDNGVPASADDSLQLPSIQLEGPPDLTSAAASAVPSQTDFDRLREEVQASREAEPLPAFVQEADRAARLNRPVRKGLLRSAALLLILLLGLQAVIHQRDLIAARCDSCAVVLAGVLPPLGLTLQAPAQIEAVEIDNAMLVQPPGVDGLRLTVLVRNKAQHPVAAPSLELSLTDAQGALLLRRVLGPQDFRRPEVLAAAEEETWELELQSAHKKIAGYTVAAFLP